MAQSLAEWIEGWASGVITTLEPDAIPSQASPRGRNSYLASAAGDRAAVQKRRGCATSNATAITGTPAIIGQYQFKRRTSGSTFSSYHLLVSNAGRLDKLNSDGTTAAADSGTAAPFTSGDHYPDFATANNLVFVVNGQENKKFNGTTVQAMGIATPTATPTLADGGGAGAHNGTYQVRYTYYNSNTGHESSASPTSANVTVANRTLTSTWTASADSQVTHVRLYARNTATMTTFRLLAIVAVGVTAATTDVADSLMITSGPDEDENDPPPTLKRIAFHAGRLFGVDAANPSSLLYSKSTAVESFDPDFYELVAKDDGDAITALHSIGANVLLIFKTNSTWGLYGDDPTTWELRNISPSVGCTSHRSVVTIEGLTYFWSERGPMAMAEASEPIAIGRELVATTITSDNVAADRLTQVCAAVDSARETVLFAFSKEAPEGDSSTRNHAILPYSYRLKRFHADEWNPLDVASLATVEDADSIPWVYLGGYKGQVFRWWATDHDGVDSGTKSGSVTSATSTTLTSSTAAFMTTGAGLAGRFVYAVAQDGLTVQRRRIGSNTATVLTLDTGLTWSVTPNSTYTFIVGGPHFEWDTRWVAYDVPFWKKRFQHVYLQFKAPATSTSLYVDVMRDLSTTVVKSTTVTANASGGAWDTATWDSASWGGTASQSERLRVAKTGRQARVRVRALHADQPFTLLRLGLTAELLSDKS